jgi:hypothetical protein
MSMNSTAAAGSASRAALPAVLYGLRLSGSVILALFVAYELELQNAFWAGTSAASRPQGRHAAPDRPDRL